MALSGTTTITGGMLEIDSGDDINGDGVFTDPGDHAPVSVALPSNPAANTTYQGHIHVNGVQEDFVYLLGEQVAASGALTVYAAHQLIGVTSINPRVEDADAIAKGDLYIGRSACGLAATAGPGPNAPSVAGDDPYATDFGTALTVPAPGVLGNDTDADGGNLIAGSASNPPGGSVTLNADGSFTYAPDAGFSGSGTFTYTVTDDHGATDTGLVTVTVGAAPPPPQADVFRRRHHRHT